MGHKSEKWRSGTLCCNSYWDKHARKLEMGAQFQYPAVQTIFNTGGSRGAGPLSCSETGPIYRD
jgi:hypothetical protein